MKTTLALSATQLLLACAVLFGAATSASAQARRVIVAEFRGAGAGALEREVRSTLGSGGDWEVVPEAEVSRAALRLSARPTSAEVAAEVGASAIVEGRASRRGRRRMLEIEVTDPSTGAALTTETFAARNPRLLRRAVHTQLWDRVGFAMARGHVPEVEPSASAPDSVAAADERPARAVPDEEEERDGASESSADGQLPPALFLALGMSVGSRELSYTDDIFLALRPYSLPAAWGLRGQARWYPGAHVTSDFVSNIGVGFTAQGAVGLTSRQRDGTTYGTEAFDLHADADLRIPLAPIELGIGLGYGVQTFALGASDAGQAADLPNVEYQYLRPSARFRADFGVGIYAQVDLGWRVLTSSGGFGAWFPRNSGSGLDAGLYLGWVSDLGIGVRAGFEMQRYFFSINPEPGDTWIAGGAADQFMSGTLDLTYRL